MINRSLILVLGLLAAALPIRAADLASLMQTYQELRGAPAGGYHLVGELTEQFHPGVQVALRSEMWCHNGRFREVQTIDDQVAHVRNWDGKVLLFGEGHRLRYPLRMDVRDFQQGFEVWELLSGSASLDAYTWALGKDASVEEQPCHQLEATSRATGTTYQLFILRDEPRVHAIAYKASSLYGGAPQSASIEYLLLDYNPETSLPRRLEVKRNGVLQLTYRLQETTPWQPPRDDFFSREAVSAYLRTKPPLGPLQANDREREALAAAVRSLLQAHEGLRVRKVVRLGKIDLYEPALLDSRTTVLIEPSRIGAHASGHYMPMDVDADGKPHMDVITLRELPAPTPDDGVGVLHEASHLLIRRRQAIEPIIAMDDEDLVAFQEEMVFLMGSLQAFEDQCFGKHGDDWETWTLRRWGHVVFRFRYGMIEHQLTREELAQFEQITGFHLDLDEIRQFYLEAGVPERLLPMQLNDRFEGILTELGKQQQTLRGELHRAEP